MDVNQGLRIAPKCKKILLFFHLFFFNFCTLTSSFLFVTEKDVKSAEKDDFDRLTAFKGHSHGLKYTKLVSIHKYSTNQTKFFCIVNDGCWVTHLGNTHKFPTARALLCHQV